MISIIVLTVLVFLMLVTQAGVIALNRTYPPRGSLVEVAGTRLNVVELGPADALGPRIVLIHGASSNLEAMRQPLGELLARNHRVVLIDRPGHGFSAPAKDVEAPLDIQAGILAAALTKLEAGRVVLVVHSLAGALGARMALDYPEQVGGLMMLAPVTHPWRGGVGWYNKAITMPVIGPLLAHTVTLPLGLLLAKPAARTVFLPQPMPEGFVRDTATLLLLRPREFRANARDLTTLKAMVAAQAPRYGAIRVPTTIISGDADKTVSTDIHSRPFAAAVPNVKLIVLEGVGHMVPQAVPDLVVSEIDVMIGRINSSREGSVSQLDADPRATIEEGLDQARRGGFISDEEIAPADARRGL
ncbi:MAG: alpha/beta hydrolase [Bradyrhizobium sp.]|uniref:alpha/beta fold hydrolase n=1 Tax=Bradyrhizobium sp. TaxID=376 RepID=UPI001D2B8F2D|nr:alpha/beta hydrolase [Bradyrhizobium sp.]MBV9566122.1 alpha/beta hydrolase [Bradyrhizobium sp.]